MAQALAAGGKERMAVSTQPYGEKQGGVEDPGRNIWWISQRLAEGSY